MEPSHNNSGSKAVAEDGSHCREDCKVHEHPGRGLGEMVFSTACLGINRGTELAFKIVHEGTILSQSLFQEISKLTSVSHPNIVKVYEVSSTPEQHIKVATESVKNFVTLQSFLQSSKGKSLSANDLGYIAYQVATGMECVESSNLVHGNLTSYNVLVGDNLFTKICDAGIALVDPEYRQLKSKNFPFEWSAPECILEGIFNIKTDVWSFGVLLWVLFTYGEKPYPGISKEELVKKLGEGFRLERPENVPDNIYQSMKSCWNPNPEERPSFACLKSELKSYNKG